eukprot:SAG31_NODE_1392_length_8533_cov_3.382974_6_plen_270_part_00
MQPGTKFSIGGCSSAQYSMDLLEVQPPVRTRPHAGRCCLLRRTAPTRRFTTGRLDLPVRSRSTTLPTGQKLSAENLNCRPIKSCATGRARAATAERPAVVTTVRVDSPACGHDVARAGAARAAARADGAGGLVPRGVPVVPCSARGGAADRTAAGASSWRCHRRSATRCAACVAGAGGWCKHLLWHRCSWRTVVEQHSQQLLRQPACAIGGRLQLDAGLRPVVYLHLGIFLQYQPGCKGCRGPRGSIQKTICPFEGDPLGPRQPLQPAG